MVIRKERPQKRILNIGEIEYVIYCRKSSEESWTWQQQSILDQLNACIEFANGKWLRLTERNDIFKTYFDDNSFSTRRSKQTNKYELDILSKAENVFYIVEEKSAKEPNNREKRNKLIKLVKDGKIKWIISFSPDRQARNLPEAWEIVQLLDEGYLDVKYTNFTFENNPSWRMVLGITFVISYNYSDNLWANIGRWNHWAMKRWTALWKFKHGYRINAEKYHEPDPDSFHLREKAFKMKLEGKIEHEIWKYLVSSWYKRKYANKTTEFNEKNMYSIRLDEFYYGIFICGDTSTDLRDSNPYYKPMIEHSEHKQLLTRYQSKNPITLRKVKPTDEYYYVKPFDNWFIITEDGRKLTFNLPSKHRYLKKLAELQETNKDATLKDVVSLSQMNYSSHKKDENWSIIMINADKVDDVVYDFLKENMKFTEDLYEEYSTYKKKWYEAKIKENSEERQKLQLIRNNIAGELDAFILDNLSPWKEKRVQEVYDKHVAKLQSMIDAVDEQIQSLSQKERSSRLEAEAFFKILKNASELYKKWSYVRKRKICNLLMSNIVIDNQKGLTVKVKPWLESLFSIKSPFGGDDGVRTHV